MAPAILIQGKGNYLILWWKEVPLGHVFLKPSQAPADHELLSAVYEAIRPALEAYREKFELPPTVAAPLTGSLVEIRAELERIFANCPPDGPGGSVELSAAICTRNRSDILRPTLESLRNMQFAPNEIIVVDNAPSDDRTKEVVSKFPEVRYVREPRPGLDVARNRAIREATCPVIAYVDDDVRVHPLWALQVQRAFRDPTISALAGLVFAAELETEAQVIFEKYWSFNRGFVEKRYNTEFLAANKPPAVWTIGAGANMAFRKSVFEAAGLFDERLDAGAAGCNGDSEMWFRILHSGHTVLYDPLPVVYHYHRRNTRDLKKQLFFYIRGFTVAALIQHERMPDAGYRRHVLRAMPKNYLRHLRRGFPSYRSRQSSVFQEVMGMVSGVLHYRRVSQVAPYQNDRYCETQ